MAKRLSLLFFMVAVAVVVLPSSVAAGHRRGQLNGKDIHNGDVSAERKGNIQIQDSDFLSEPVVTQTSVDPANSGTAGECNLYPKESIEKLMGRIEKIIFSNRRMSQQQKTAEKLRFMSAFQSRIRGALKCADSSRLMVDIDAVITKFEDDIRRFKHLPIQAPPIRRVHAGQLSERKPLRISKREQMPQEKCIEKLAVPVLLSSLSAGTARVSVAQGDGAAFVVTPGAPVEAISVIVAVDVFCNNA